MTIRVRRPVNPASRADREHVYDADELDVEEGHLILTRTSGRILSTVAIYTPGTWTHAYRAEESGAGDGEGT